MQEDAAVLNANATNNNEIRINGTERRYKQIHNYNCRV
jgi:hypothetical protein